MFQSGTMRFVTPKPSRMEDITVQDHKEVVKHAALYGSHQKNLYDQIEDSMKEIIDQNANVATIGKYVGFNSKAPRFKTGYRNLPSSPGPGEYDEGKIRTQEDLKRALQEAEGIIMKSPKSLQTAAFKSEERLKHAMVNLVSVK